MKITTTKMTCEDFLSAANGRARTRLFDEDDYAAFALACLEAAEAASQGEPYYATGDAGGTCSSYDYKTTTAQWGTWVTPELKVHHVVHRQVAGGSRHVKCPYYGGERSYRADFRRAMEQGPKLTTMAQKAQECAAAIKHGIENFSLSCDDVPTGLAEIDTAMSHLDDVRGKLSVATSV